MMNSRAPMTNNKEVCKKVQRRLLKRVKMILMAVMIKSHRMIQKMKILINKTNQIHHNKLMKLSNKSIIHNLKSKMNSAHCLISRLVQRKNQMTQNKMNHLMMCWRIYSKIKMIFKKKMERKKNRKRLCRIKIRLTPHRWRKQKKNWTSKKLKQKPIKN